MKRGLTKRRPTDHCGCKSLTAFDERCAKGIVPQAITRSSDQTSRLVRVFFGAAEKAPLTVRRPRSTPQVMLDQ